MPLGDEEPWSTKFWHHTRRVLPRVTVIVLVFVGLNWWVNSQKETQPPAVTQPPTIASAWDADRAREPGVAIAIVLDEHQPAAVDAQAFAAWREGARQFITDYHSQVVKIAGTHDQIKVRVGLYRTAADVSDTSSQQQLPPPSQADVEEAFNDNHWTAQADQYDEVLRQAIHDLSLAGMASTTVLLVRHTERAEYLDTSMLRNSLSMSGVLGLPTLPKGPYLMLVLYDPDAEKPLGYSLKWLLQQAFPMLAIDVPHPSPPLSMPSDR